MPLIQSIDNFISSLTFTDVFHILIAFITIYLIYKFATFGDITLSPPESKVNDHNNWKRLYKAKELPPFFPNGWIPVLESRQLKRCESKPVSAVGQHFAVFRGDSGRVYVLDAFCAHLGAHLGFDSQVIGDSVRCAFHGWQWDGRDGQCSRVPDIDKPPKAAVKVWDSMEVNGFILVWHHREGLKPDWSVERIDSLFNKEYVYRGRFDYPIKCHIQDNMSNLADLVHFTEVHHDPKLTNTFRGRERLHNLFLTLLPHTLRMTWEVCPQPNQHKTYFEYEYRRSVLGCPLFRTFVYGYQVGAGLQQFDIDTTVLGMRLKAYLTHAFIPEAPMETRFISHYYTTPTIFGYIAGKILIYSSSQTILNDVVIWSNKKLVSQPILSKNESSLAKFTRWYSQFYTDKNDNEYLAQ